MHGMKKPLPYIKKFNISMKNRDFLSHENNDILYSDFSVHTAAL